jgi:hypothetical protein
MAIFNLHRLILLSLLGVFASFTPSLAQNLQIRTGAGDDIKIHMTLEDLDAFSQTEFTTSTIWTDGDIQFSGVSLKMLLTHLNVKGDTLTMTALNDYAVAMPVADLTEDAPIIATRMNGAVMPVRDKGPFWVVYPYDDNALFSTETNYTRSIWQLNRLHID